MILKLGIFIFAAHLLFGCSSYIDKIYSELDKQSDVNKNKSPKDKFAHFKTFNDKSKSISSSNYKYLPPKTQRQYKAIEESGTRRYTTEDLYDNTKTNGLWANMDADNHLFTQNSSKQNGDIIVVNVFEDLKSKISMELKRAYPDIPKPNNAASPSKTPASVPEAQPSTETAGNAKDSEKDDQDKVFDKISSIVVDQINKDHLLIRGRKNVIYKGNKRTVEVEALVSRRSISVDDSVNSNDILESYVEVLR